MLFIVRQIFRNKIEGSVGLYNLSSFFGMTCGLILNHFCHIVHVLNTVLESNGNSKLFWPDVVERRSRHGLVTDFLNVLVSFCTKKNFFWPFNEDEQEDRFDG